MDIRFSAFSILTNVSFRENEILTYIRLEIFFFKGNVESGGKTNALVKKKKKERKWRKKWHFLYIFLIFVIVAYCRAADNCAGIPTAFSGARIGPLCQEQNPHVGRTPPP